MSHINHQEGTYLIRNLAHAGIIPLTAVGTTTTDNQLRLVFQSQLLHLVVIHTTRLLVQVVADRIVENTRSIDVAAMRKMTAVIEVQSHKSITWFQYGEQYGCVSLSTRVRLHVGILSTKDFLHAFDGKVLYDIHHLASTIVALARKTLCILVGKVRTHSVITSSLTKFSEAISSMPFS